MKIKKGGIKMNRRRKMTSANEKIINEYSKYAAELMRNF